MMLPQTLQDISAERPSSGAEPGVPPPDQKPTLDRPKLSRITEHFESLEDAGTLVFEPGVVDRVIYAKVLPKLRGDDSPRFRNALEECRTALNESNLTRSARKVDELVEDVEQTGSFRFWR